MTRCRVQRCDFLGHGEISVTLVPAQDPATQPLWLRGKRSFAIAFFCMLLSAHHHHRLQRRNLFSSTSSSNTCGWHPYLKLLQDEEHSLEQSNARASRARATKTAIMASPSSSSSAASTSATSELGRASIPVLEWLPESSPKYVCADCGAHLALQVRFALPTPQLVRLWL